MPALNLWLHELTQPTCLGAAPRLAPGGLQAAEAPLGSPGWPRPFSPQPLYPPGPTYDVHSPPAGFRRGADQVCKLRCHADVHQQPIVICMRLVNIVMLHHIAVHFLHVHFTFCRGGAAVTAAVIHVARAAVSTLPCTSDVYVHPLLHEGFITL